MNKPVIISLTAKGHLLAKRLLRYLDAEHLTNPKPFAATIQQKFNSGQRLIFICATGIVIRTLAPVIKDKKSDPAVLVLDENGEFIIPLLSGHEGGANEWGRNLADSLGSKLVLTTSNKYTDPLYVAGLGSDRGCPLEILESVFLSVLKQGRLTPEKLSGLASIDLKQDEQAMLQLANKYQLPIHFYPAKQLRLVEEKLSQKSDIVFREVGCYGVAEAAALIDASRQGQADSELYINKQKNRRATCAIALSYQEKSDQEEND